MIVRAIDAHEVAKWWPCVAELIQSALAEGDGDITEADIRRVCECGDMQLFVGIGAKVEAVLITAIEVRPQGKVCRVVGFAGTLDWALGQMPVLERFGRAAGCRALEMQGRRGWLKRLPPNWRAKHVVMRCEL